MNKYVNGIENSYNDPDKNKLRQKLLGDLSRSIQRQDWTTVTKTLQAFFDSEIMKPVLNLIEAGDPTYLKDGRIAATSIYHTLLNMGLLQYFVGNEPEIDWLQDESGNYVVDTNNCYVIESLRAEQGYPKYKSDLEAEATVQEELEDQDRCSIIHLSEFHGMVEDTVDISEKDDFEPFSVVNSVPKSLSLEEVQNALPQNHKIEKLLEIADIACSNPKNRIGNIVYYLHEHSDVIEEVREMVETEEDFVIRLAILESFLYSIEYYRQNDEENEFLLNSLYKLKVMRPILVLMENSDRYKRAISEVMERCNLTRHFKGFLGDVNDSIYFDDEVQRAQGIDSGKIFGYIVKESIFNGKKEKAIEYLRLLYQKKLYQAILDVLRDITQERGDDFGSKFVNLLRELGMWEDVDRFQYMQQKQHPEQTSALSIDHLNAVKQDPKVVVDLAQLNYTHGFELVRYEIERDPKKVEVFLADLFDKGELNSLRAIVEGFYGDRVLFPMLHELMGRIGILKPQIPCDYHFKNKDEFVVTGYKGEFLATQRKIDEKPAVVVPTPQHVEAPSIQYCAEDGNPYSTNFDEQKSERTGSERMDLTKYMRFEKLENYLEKNPELACLYVFSFYNSGRYSQIEEIYRMFAENSSKQGGHLNELLLNLNVIDPTVSPNGVCIVDEDCVFSIYHRSFINQNPDCLNLEAYFQMQANIYKKLLSYFHQPMLASDPKPHILELSKGYFENYAEIVMEHGGAEELMQNLLDFIITVKNSPDFSVNILEHLLLKLKVKVRMGELKNFGFQSKVDAIMEPETGDALPARRPKRNGNGNGNGKKGWMRKASVAALRAIGVSKFDNEELAYLNEQGIRKEDAATFRKYFKKMLTVEEICSFVQLGVRRPELAQKLIDSFDHEDINERISAVLEWLPGLRIGTHYLDKFEASEVFTLRVIALRTDIDFNRVVQEALKRKNMSREFTPDDWFEMELQDGNLIADPEENKTATCNLDDMGAIHSMAMKDRWKK